ncbi:hypothetical protein CY35_08G069300 [Sphagnum magellanicum]|nr:hypothetical protein CY35_08G069300 [Sphagnum magellanicum]
MPPRKEIGQKANKTLAKRQRHGERERERSARKRGREWRLDLLRSSIGSLKRFFKPLCPRTQARRDLNCDHGARGTRERTVPLEVYPANRHKAYCQMEASPADPSVLALCPKGDYCHDNAPLELEEEDLILTTEEGEQGRVPVLIIRPKTSETVTTAPRPAVVCLHSTGNSKETMRPFMEALVAAWETGEEMPFIFDTVWDIIKLMDYLTTRPDIDPTHIGMMGISLGGMNTWFAAAADPRIAVAVALIGVQSFGWAIAEEKWHARVASIPYPFQAAADDFGREIIDTETVAAVWQRLAPGIMDTLDSPRTIPAIAPRPFLIHNGKEDPRCPVGGLESVLNKTTQVYHDMGVPSHFKFIAEEGLGHVVTPTMAKETMCWFNKFLVPEQPGMLAH